MLRLLAVRNLLTFGSLRTFDYDFFRGAVGASKS